MAETVAARTRNTRGLLLLAVVVLSWGTMWPVNKALLAYMPPIWSIALRTCISALALFAISLTATGVVAPKRGDAPVLISMVLLIDDAVSFAFDDDLYPVAPDASEACVRWVPGRGWLSSVPAHLPQAALIDLYLPLCGATAPARSPSAISARASTASSPRAPATRSSSPGRRTSCTCTACARCPTP